jgi:hypothetical protein
MRSEVITMGDPGRAPRKLSEDWLSVIVGLILVLVVGLGLLAKAPWPLFGWFSK